MTIQMTILDITESMNQGSIDQLCVSTSVNKFQYLLGFPLKLSFIYVYIGFSHNIKKIYVKK